MNKHTHAMFAASVALERINDAIQGPRKSPDSVDDANAYGRDARRRCVPHNCNPYRSGTVSHVAWSQGWGDEDQRLHDAMADDEPEAFMLMHYYGGRSYDVSGPYPSVAEARLACTDACDVEIEKGRRYSSEDGRWVIYPAGENERVIARMADDIVTQQAEDAAEAAWEQRHGAD